MRFWGEALLLGGLAAFASQQVVVAQSPILTRDWAQHLEAELDLHAALSATDRRSGDPKPITEYARYYRVVEIDGKAIVEAVFAPPVELHPSDWRTSRYTANGMEDLGPAAQPSEEALRRGRRDIHIDEPFAVIFDGGCEIVTLSIDYESRRVLSAHCNGVA
ncbi:MAG: hypothetical protein ACI9YM_002594 [Brevundimonas sp.]|jgi:hypothetical protein